MPTMSTQTMLDRIRPWINAQLHAAWNAILTALQADITTVTSTASSNSSAITALQTLNGTTANAVDGAINVAAAGTEVQTLTKAGVGAYTLAAPAAAGLKRIITSETANAHVITATNLIDDGTAADRDTLTFAAQPGASVMLVSTATKWNVVALNGVTVG